MNHQIENAPESHTSPIRFALTSLGLGILAIAPIGLILLLFWLKTVGHYLHPLIVTVLCPAGGFGLIAISRAEINILRKQSQGKTTRGLQITYTVLGILGVIAALFFMFLALGYIVSNYGDPAPLS